MNDYKIGDEFWWFQINLPSDINKLCARSLSISAGDIELVHDVVKTNLHETDDFIEGFFGLRHIDDIWGKTREEAFQKLKEHFEKWGKFND